MDDIGLDYIKEHPSRDAFGNRPLDCCIEMGSSPPVSENALFVDDIGLDNTKVHPARDAFGNRPPDCCIPMGSSPLVSENALCVDDIGLEPMTFRTSSGCSSQLS